jgi:hypothetical protein
MPKHRLPPKFIRVTRHDLVVAYTRWEEELRATPAAFRPTSECRAIEAADVAEEQVKALLHYLGK